MFDLKIYLKLQTEYISVSFCSFDSSRCRKKKTDKSRRKAWWKQWLRRNDNQSLYSILHSFWSFQLFLEDRGTQCLLELHSICSSIIFVRHHECFHWLELSLSTIVRIHKLLQRDFITWRCCLLQISFKFRCRKFHTFLCEKSEMMSLRNLDFSLKRFKMASWFWVSWLKKLY